MRTICKDIEKGKLSMTDFSVVGYFNKSNANCFDVDLSDHLILYWICFYISKLSHYTRKMWKALSKDLNQHEKLKCNWF